MMFTTKISIESANDITKKFLMISLVNMYDGWDDECSVERMEAYELVLEDFCLADEFTMFIKEHATKGNR